MAALMEATERYLSRDNRAMGAVASVVASTMALPTSGGMTRAGGSTSPIAQVTSAFRSMIGALRSINNEKDKQREIVNRVRRATDEDRREQGAPIRNILEQPAQTEETNQRPGGIFETILSILRKIFSSIKTIMTLIIRTITQLTRVILRTGMTIVTGALRAVLAGISSIMRNPRLRILAMGATAVAAAAAYIFGRGDEEAPEAPITPSPGPATPSSRASPTAPAPGPATSPPGPATSPGAPERTMQGGPLPEGFGSLAARYESRGNPGAIGFDTTGGWSYGSAQIATRTGTMSRFLQYLELKHPSAAASLRAAGGNEGAIAGTEEFKQAWRNLASTDQRFNQTQKDFITDTHYIPLVEKVLRETGVDISQRSRALQEVVNSTAIQHGARTNIVTQAIQAAGGINASDEDIIQKVYDERPNRFGSSTAQVQASVQRRFVSERQVALRMLEAERQAQPQPQPTMTAGTQMPSSPEPVTPTPSQAPQTVASLPTSGMGATETITQVQPIVIRERAA